MEYLPLVHTNRSNEILQHASSWIYMVVKLPRWNLHVSHFILIAVELLCRPCSRAISYDRKSNDFLTALSGCICDTITLFCPAGLCIMIAASIYTAELHTSETEGGYGHSYVLAWISFVLTFLLAITYLVLRKKSEWEKRNEAKPGIMFPVWIWGSKE